MRWKKMDKTRFKEELIELLWKYQIEVSAFLNMVNKDEFWIDMKKPNKKLQNLIDKGIEVKMNQSKGDKVKG